MKNKTDFSSELIFRSTRSSGKGGQNVNKVSSKSELYFDIINSNLLSEKEKQLLVEKLKTRISREGMLKMTCSSERSQLYNKRLVTEKFYQLLEKCFLVKKPRIATETSKSAKEKRIKEKKLLSEKKQNRGKQFSVNSDQ